MTMTGPIEFSEECVVTYAFDYAVEMCTPK